MYDPYAEREKIRALRAAHYAETVYPAGHENEMGALERAANDGSTSEEDKDDGVATTASLEDLRAVYEELLKTPPSPKWSVGQLQKRIDDYKVANPPAA